MNAFTHLLKDDKRKKEISHTMHVCCAAVYFHLFIYLFIYMFKWVSMYKHTDGQWDRHVRQRHTKMKWLSNRQQQQTTNKTNKKETKPEQKKESKMELI